MHMTRPTSMKKAHLAYNAYNLPLEGKFPNAQGVLTPPFAFIFSKVQTARGERIYNPFACL